MKKITLILILFLCFPAIANANNCKKGIACGNGCISANKVCGNGTNIDTNSNIHNYDYTENSIPILNNQTTNKQNFDNAKTELIKIYKAHPEQKEFYCGCDFSWSGKLSIVDLNSCGYSPRKNQNRAERIEWEHVMPAENFGHQLKCWRDGGRKACKKYIAFNKMEGDMHNLQPSVGEVNGDRSNYAYNQFTKDFEQYGQCKVATDFKNRQFQPRDESKGIISRTYLYMSNKYKIRLSEQDQRLMAAWNKMYPPTTWECERNQIIKQVQGNDNQFITDECKTAHP